MFKHIALFYIDSLFFTSVCYVYFIFFVYEFLFINSANRIQYYISFSVPPESLDGVVDILRLFNAQRRALVQCAEVVEMKRTADSLPPGPTLVLLRENTEQCKP